MTCRVWRGTEQEQIARFQTLLFPETFNFFFVISRQKVWTADAVGKDKALHDLAKNIQIKPDLFAQTKKQTRHELAECESLIYFTF